MSLASPSYLLTSFAISLRLTTLASLPWGIVLACLSLCLNEWSTISSLVSSCFIALNKCWFALPKVSPDDRATLSDFGWRGHSEWVDSVWVLKEVVLDRVHFNIFPTAARPSAWNEMHFSLPFKVKFNIKLVLHVVSSSNWLVCSGHSLHLITVVYLVSI